MKFIEDHKGTGNRCYIHIVKPLRKAIRSLEQATQDLVVRRDYDPSSVEERIIGMLPGLQCNEWRKNLTASRVSLAVTRQPELLGGCQRLAINTLSERAKRQSVDQSHGTYSPI